MVLAVTNYSEDVVKAIENLNPNIIYHHCSADGEKIKLCLIFDSMLSLHTVEDNEEDVYTVCLTNSEFIQYTYDFYKQLIRWENYIKSELREVRLTDLKKLIEQL